mmetsp:Transcript_31441/g.67913  ORF Transcript_31441/g.67913 Transcript_31441/m.67913 type:complete len:204 (+) Transcript_31441:1248-1859(+)
MLEHPATPRHKVTARQGYMPLHRSVERGHVEVSQMLLGAGAIVNASSCGMTPLHLSAHIVEMSRMLIGAGADVNALDDWTCSTVFQCLITYLNEGLKSDGITDVLFRPSEVSGYPKSLWSDPAELLKILWDLSFYILVVIVLLALVAGIIIDSFGALRDESTKKMDLLRNVCIVCGQTRTAFQDIPGGFEQHVRVPRVLLGVD